MSGSVLQPPGTAVAPGWYQPRALLFKVLAWLWLFPSAGAIWILVHNRHRWLAKDSTVSLRSVAFEEWVAVVLLLLHVTFAVLAWRLKRTEPSRPIPANDGSVEA